MEKIPTLKHELIAKREIFVKEYLVDFNATAAARRAGFTPKSCRMAARILLDKEVAEAVRQEIEARKERVLITADQVILGLREVAERCMQKVMVTKRVNGELVQDTDIYGRGVWTFDAAGANRALELLGKHLALFTDKFEVKGDLRIETLASRLDEANKRGD